MCTVGAAFAVGVLNGELKQSSVPDVKLFSLESFSAIAGHCTNPASSPGVKPHSAWC